MSKPNVTPLHLCEQNLKLQELVDSFDLLEMSPHELTELRQALQEYRTIVDSRLRDAVYRLWLHERGLELVG